ncbi:DUF6153 family protein [Streptomyces fuscichromogenes]|uniref:Uncharacterized protein n=1 Tax=Streptomyces fuscichromogenes TaxID=1324013 RepID=A0A917XLA6_9ACTN|nr:DUF6153 family protein [Streptomyces fuscichromogenes]GGN35382.1 hypothetical protein GCM10011578_077330 [Streptomyces fuscichromogenes]
MRPTEQPAPRPPYRRWRALLVLGLLTGLLGMHALAPGGVLGPHGGHQQAASATMVMATAYESCSGHDGHCGDHHAHHADATCVSGAVSGGPALPVLVPDPVAALAGDCLAPSRPAAAPDGARAPPDLAELQLLRI